jgi:gliding motility-associated-like protein
MKQKTFSAIILLCFIVAWQSIYAQPKLRRGIDAVTTYNKGSFAYPYGARIKAIGNPIAAGASIITGATGASAMAWPAPSTLIQPTAWDSLTHIFGTDIDLAGNVYFTRTKFYGYSAFPGVSKIVVYKADASNLNNITNIVLADNVSGGVIGTNTIKNNFHGLGNVTTHKSLPLIYFSNLDDGTIYCCNSTTGNIVAVFDPLGVDATGNAVAPVGEIIYGLDINYENDGTVRLYYSVLKTATTNEIRSVQLSGTGTFITATDATEIIVPTTQNNQPLTDIRFNSKGYLSVVERGNAHDASAFEFYGKHNAWSTAKFLPVSNYSTQKNSNGGVTYASVIKPAATGGPGSIVCDSLIWITENALNGVSVYGGHSLPSSSTGGSLSPLAGNNYCYQNTGTSYKGQFGDIEFFDSCTAAKASNPCDGFKIFVSPDTGCCYNIEIQNSFNANYISSIVFTTTSMNIAATSTSSIPNWSFGAPSLHSVSFAGDPTKNDKLPLGVYGIGKLCFTGANSETIKVKWVGNAPQNDTACESTFQVQCVKPVSASCAVIQDLSYQCDSFGNPTMQFIIKNNSNFTMRGLTIYNTNPDVEAISTLASGGNPFVPIPDLAAGATSALITVPLQISNNATKGCFFFAACDINLPSGSVGPNGGIVTSKFCCIDSIAYCLDQIVKCDACLALSVSSNIISNNECCFKISLQNNFTADKIQSVLFTSIAGLQFNLTHSSGWSIVPSASSTFRRIDAVAGGVGIGVYNDFVDFCLTGTATPPYKVQVQYVTTGGDTLCADTIQFENCQLKNSDCANIYNDSLYCENGKTMYSFFIRNNSPFAIGEVDIRLDDQNYFKADKDTMHFAPLLPTGSSAGPFTISIDTINGGAKNFCIYLTAHNAAYTSTSAATACCTDSAKICLPFLECKNNGCCDFDAIIIPNGITPNADGFNDKLVLTTPASCDSIAITIMNRWGNVVYKDPHYLNNWGGTNQSGSLLPQGTYFMIIELKNGSKKGLYVDVRY